MWKLVLSKDVWTSIHAKLKGFSVKDAPVIFVKIEWPKELEILNDLGEGYEESLHRAKRVAGQLLGSGGGVTRG